MTQDSPQKLRKRDAQRADEAARAAKVLNDEGLAKYRSQKVRRILATVLAGLALAIVPTYGMGLIPVLLNMIAVVGAWFFLGRIIRGFIDLPENLLDERIRERRDDSFRFAYIGITAVIGLIVPHTLLSARAGNAIFYGMDPLAGFLALFWLAVTLPTIIFAWREPEL